MQMYGTCQRAGANIKDQMNAFGNENGGTIQAFLILL